MLRLIVILIASACAPLTAEPLPDARSSPCDQQVVVSGTLEPDGLARVFRWSSPYTTSFVELCSSSPHPVSLVDTRSPVAILATQRDGCIEPQDGVFDDLVLFADVPYMLRVYDDQPVTFRLHFIDEL
jgi:hypothetical protein